MSDSDSSAFYVSSDIGGTFTDTVVTDASGLVQRYKASTTPDNLVSGVLATFELAAEQQALPLGDFLGRVKLFSQGTTFATNDVLERRGARVGVLHTAGFGQTLFVSRVWKAFGLGESELKNYRNLVKPEPIVERRLVREVPERVDYAGRVLMPLDEDATRDAVRQLLEEGAESFAISLLWCFKHPEHERRVVEIVNEEAPGAYVTASSDILPRINEYERTVTAAVNSFLGPNVRSATATLDASLKEAGLQLSPLLMLSNGGVGSISQVAEQPVSILLSGPVGGIVGSRFVAGQLGEKNVVTCDMGGTSFDVGLVVDGQSLMQPSTIMANQPISVPSIAVESIGAGGGSIATVVDGRLTVGPESAGAVPGPACYSNGGTDATVTDADVVLGHINPDNFLGGRIKLDAGLAAKAVAENVAEPLGISLEEAAAGIKRIVDSQMADLIRRVTVHKGFDPREFVMLAFGGAGPMHAHAFGAELGVKKIVVPVTASVHSAYGILASDVVISRERTESFFTPPGAEGASKYVDADRVNDILAGLEEQARETIAEQGVEPRDFMVSRFVTMRFRFQIHELTVEIPTYPFDGEALDKLVEHFIASYERRFGEGSAFTAAGVEMVTWRVVATGVLDKPSLGQDSSNGRAPNEPEKRKIFDGDWVDAEIHDESALVAEQTVSGPAIFELPDTTIVVGREQIASVDAHRNVILEAA